MALNCNTCDKRKAALAEGHCTEFTMIPQVDACAMYRMDASLLPPVQAKQEEAPSYLWLDQTHDSIHNIKSIKS